MKQPLYTIFLSSHYFYIMSRHFLQQDAVVTSNGIETLVQQLQQQPQQERSCSSPPTVLLFAQRKAFPEVFVLSDDRHELETIFLPAAIEKINDAFLTDDDDNNVLVHIKGIVVSAAAAAAARGVVPHDNPMILVADLDVVSFQATSNEEVAQRRLPWKWPKATSTASSSSSSTRHNNSKIQGGKVPVFLKEWTPFLSNEELAGCLAWNRTLFPNSNLLKEQNQAVSEFLEHHAAIRTLHRSQSSTAINVSTTSNTGNTNNGSNSNNIQNSNMTGAHLSALREFEGAQMDRQKASLTSNAGKENAQGAAKVVKQYRKALEYALSEESISRADQSYLTVELLCKWHKILCGEGLNADAGKIRKKKVHVGATSFRPPEFVRQDLETVCMVLRTLEPQLLKNNVQEEQKALFAATYASIVFMGIVDVHPFADGNGRLARIAVNWALRRAGVPFVIHLFATPAQRYEYTAALKLSRRNVALLPMGDVTQEQLLSAYRTAGSFLPFVQLILGRLAKTVAEFQKLVQEKSLLRNEEDEARAARNYRQRAAQGNCLICFENNPNIATLCCGKAVHLNCMAEWLSQNNSCPQCRNELPLLPARMRAPSTGGGASNVLIGQLDGDTSSTTSGDDDSESTTEEDSANEGITADVDETTTSEDDDTTDETTTEEASDDVTGQEEDDDTTDETSEDDTTCMEHDSTSEIAQPAIRTELPPKCSHPSCNNRSARDCDNYCCGRCCLMHGRYECARHNG